MGAGQERVGYYISNSESMVIEPILNTFIRLNKKFMDPRQGAAWIMLHKDYKDKNPLDIMNAKVIGYCYASIRQRSKMNFLQNFPNIAQTIFNPELIQMLAQQQKVTINVDAFERSIWDAIQYTPRGRIFIPMSDEQKQAMAQPPAEAKLQAQVQQMQMQLDKSIHDNQNIVKLIDSLIKQGFGHHAQMAQLDDKETQHKRDTAKELLLQHMQGEQAQDQIEAQPAPTGGQ